MRTQRQQGFTLMEVLVAMVVGMIVIGMAVQLFRQAVVTTTLLQVRAELQQNGRAAMNSISYDIALAGTGLPLGGIALPQGPGTAVPQFACDMSGICPIANSQIPGRQLFYSLPGNDKGTLRASGVPTDVITVVYADPTINLEIDPPAANNNISAAGTLVTLSDVRNQDLSASVVLDNPATGIVPGDAMVLSNVNGAAIGIVTRVSAVLNGGTLEFADGNILQFNQSAATDGNIRSIATSPGNYPGTRLVRVHLITYFLVDQPNGTKTLMRQDAAHPPQPVAEGLDNLTFSYDTFDDATAALRTDRDDVPGAENLIRKVNFSVELRSVRRSDAAGQFETLKLATGVSPRNLSFRDRYN